MIWCHVIGLNFLIYLESWGQKILWLILPCKEGGKHQLPFMVGRQTTVLFVTQHSPENTCVSVIIRYVSRIKVIKEETSFVGVEEVKQQIWWAYIWDSMALMRQQDRNQRSWEAK